jgi:energy-coupling factor transporter ATP-binding protein EcfA2
MVTDSVINPVVVENRRPNRLLSLELTGFRGFNRSMRLDFDASAVLINGANGSGKTSLFDALQWLLTGDIPRLQALQLRKADEYLLNTYVRSEQAIVEAYFRVDDKEVRARRRGTSRNSALDVETHGGKFSQSEAEKVLARLLAPGELALSEVLHTSGLLQQDDLRQLLQTKPDARYRQLMRLLGLEAVEHFERVAAGRKKQAAEARSLALEASKRAHAQVAHAHEQLETAQLQVERASSTVDLAGRLERIASELSGAVRFAGPVLSQASLEPVLEDAGRLRRQVEYLARVEAGMPSSLPSGSGTEVAALDSQLASSEANVDAARRTLVAATASREAAQRTHDAITRLAAAALPLLEAHDSEARPCPVCDSPVDHAAVAARLTVKASGAELVASAQVARDEAQSLLRSQQNAHEALVENRAALLQESERRAEVVERWRQLYELIPALEVGTYVAAVALWRPINPSELAPDTRGYAYMEMQQHREELRVALAGLLDAVGQIELRLREVLQEQAAARMAAERAGSLPRFIETVERLREEAAMRAAEHEASRRSEQTASALASATTSAAAEIFRDRFATLEPLMNDVYARLAPHPSFSHLSFRVESFRAKGTATAIVTDYERDITINPLLIFSSAQTNIVVLAAFLALGWAAGNSGLPFLLLDDPMQALDDVNVLGFADLARFVRRERQLVLGTHEQRFAGLLERKLSGRREREDLLIHDFVGWSRSGPEVETRRVEPVEVAARVLSTQVA